MSRSSWKQTYFTPFFVKCLKKLNLKKKLSKRLVFNRSSNIPQALSNFGFYIYNGRLFNSLKISPILEKKKFGEFSTTRKPFFFPKKKVKNKKR